ncbi:unnamed protein product [Clavelina lepadiformis]|uniref:Uncharacterized protein n=1 Tax=Clavelina lepadiformis TaxID=159417 RepID=A0ABP0FIV2_CLALP
MKDKGPNLLSSPGPYCTLHSPACILFGMSEIEQSHITWYAICSFAPHSQVAKFATPHFYRVKPSSDEQEWLHRGEAQ